jgi:glutamate 5-kinase
MQTNIPKNVPVSIPRKQAFAAMGQIRMMEKWNVLFDVPCAQILITHDDINNRRRYVNAKNTMKELLKLKALPIVNENDTVAVQELKVGDNDNLAAHVADIVEADLLIICSDITGLYDANPKFNPNAQLFRWWIKSTKKFMLWPVFLIIPWPPVGCRPKSKLLKKQSPAGSTPLSSMVQNRKLSSNC